MALIKSISGIRGTIGGIPGTALTPLDIVRFTAAYAQFIRQQSDTERLTIVVGRDARISGAMVNTLVTGTLLAMGVDVIDTGLSTTPTVEVSVINIKADGGIIITASHNPAQWNALKLLNHHGEFLSAADGEEILRLADSDEIHFAEATALGTLIERHDTIQEHIRQVLALDLVDVEAIRKANFNVAVDAVNSTGGIAIPALLEALGVKEIKKIYCDPDGDFPHNPEPLPENLTEIAKVMRQGNYYVGFVVDPDVDRLAIICENGEMFGEEYTLVAVADYVLSHTPGNTVSNLSSSRALRDVTVAAGGSYQASAVGEVNVVELMKKTNAVIGGEGNGGIIYPAAHYGRDALVGIALFLTFMAKEKATPTEIRKRYPAYFISKNKSQLSPALDVDDILKKVADSYRHERVTTIDGVKVDFDKEWVHLRKSNTEPIIRIYAESTSAEKATALAKSVIDKIKSIAGI
ncbi:MAG: phosphoglucosamine mutase [Bacteroidales bacterium]|nr:phosphoglucosamine mutase [Bacteroidales bacterium]